jgi:hypothetical protein
VLSDRVKSFHWIVSAGGYWSSAMGGLGRKALARDLCLGLSAGHLLRPQLPVGIPYTAFKHGGAGAAPHAGGCRSRQQVPGSFFYAGLRRRRLSQPSPTNAEPMSVSDAGSGVVTVGVKSVISCSGSPFAAEYHRS